GRGLRGPPGRVPPAPRGSPAPGGGGGAGPPPPPPPAQVVHYDRRERARLAVRPGLTGWAQLQARGPSAGLSRPQWAELDLWYVEHRSFGLDLRILGLTVKALLCPDDGAVGDRVRPGRRTGRPG
ncbi:sugar transferase, partial [Kitasatospora sp. NPDC059747]|uniref:sugar transferase n=1 Tax=Kitasatospora sp. NPDC059747 TaxID=3346930 RepID=UPI003668DDD2